jgi:CcmD family protein
MLLKYYVIRSMSFSQEDEGIHVKNLWYLFAAYAIIWTALGVYMLRLSQKNKALQAELRALQAQVEKTLSR